MNTKRELFVESVSMFNTRYENSEVRFVRVYSSSQNTRVRDSFSETGPRFHN